MPEVYKQFLNISQLLEKHYHDMQDMEFTVERGKLFMLQTRNGEAHCRRCSESCRRYGGRRPY